MDSDRKIHVQVETHEGTLFYLDDQGHAGPRRAIAFAIMATVVDDKGEAQVVWRHGGTPGMVAEALARYFTSTPGMWDAVQGMIVREMKERAARGGLG